MKKEIIFTNKAPMPKGSYSQAVKAGNLLYVSGQAAVDPKTGKFLAPGDIETQTDLVMKNIEEILKAGGSSLENVIKTSVFIGNRLPEEICKRIYVRQYKKFCQRHYQKQDVSITGFKPDKTMDIFRDEILAWYKEVIMEQETIDFNITQAMIKEQNVKGNGDFSYINSMVKKMDELAQPLIVSESDQTQSDAYWGIHSSSVEEFLDDQKDELFGKGTGLIEDTAFSKYELIRYKNRCGLFAEDLTAFRDDNSGNPGSYFAAYKSLIRKMETKDGIVTPHLDKRWHLPAYMPDLNQEQEMVALT